jgi:ATP-dependent Clp protease adaptor protein ClpS
MATTEVYNKTRSSEKIKEPSMFRVIYLNDNQTAMEFVVESLVEHFEYTVDLAHQITLDIHSEGSAVVAVLPYEIAEQKGSEVIIKAREQSYPLQVKLEPDAAN